MTTAIQILLVFVLLIFLFFALIILDSKDDNSDKFDAQLKTVFDELNSLRHRVRTLEDKLNNEEK